MHLYFYDYIVGEMILIINPEFFSDKLEGFKDKEKMIVHEFAKKIWGVFEEHGYPGDPHFPLLYNVIIIDIQYPFMVHFPSSDTNLTTLPLPRIFAPAPRSPGTLRTRSQAGNVK